MVFLYSKKVTLFVLLLCISLWRILLGAEDPPFFRTCLQDKDCGTLEDPNYNAAFYALQKAMWVVNPFSQPYVSFPRASDDVYDACGNPFFSYEGELSWGVERTDLLCKRIIQRANLTDLSQCITQCDGVYAFLNMEKEVQIFKLHKNYAALLSVFHKLHHDLEFLWENNKKFLRMCRLYCQTDHEIFSGVGLTKVMKSYRKLKRANNLLTFEAMAISKKNQLLIQLEATRRSQARDTILRHSNLKIQSDKQGKHIIGHKNYLSSEKKSILSHSSPQDLIDKFAGKGMRVTELSPGVPGYQEIVNFLL